MNITPIDFETWCSNHANDHEAKWCRELYPWEVFSRIDYNQSSINKEQTIEISDHTYSASITKRQTARNGRENFLIHLKCEARNKSQQWDFRQWDTFFHLVTDQSGFFITLFTEKKDPSKVFVRKFFNSALKDIEQVRSLPISGLLFRSLISYAAYEKYPDLDRYKIFKLKNDIRSGSKQTRQIIGSEFEPFLSKGRKLWILFSFTEEKAHRLALRISGQAEHISIVFCHPTFTRHHRCNEETVSVLSLSEFLRTLSADIFRQYIQQTRFLINHLRQGPGESDKKTTSDEILYKINSCSAPFNIHTSELREAKTGLGIVTYTTGDVAYVCACANLLNACLNRKLKTYNGTQFLAKEIYSFKAIFCRAVEEIISQIPPNVSVYVDGKDLLYIRVSGLQFSFHAIPRTAVIRKYQRSSNNKPQEWDGIKLQPVAPLVLKWARALLNEEEAKN